MGPGVPSAVAAKLAHPNRTVIAHVGDGGFLMTGQEMATAKQFGTNIITIVYNNEGYNSIRMHQEAQYPGRQYGVGLENPDFALMRSEEHTSELQSLRHLVCRLLLEKKK